MPALPVRRLATSALCASLLIGAATPAFAANSADVQDSRTFVSLDPAPGTAPAAPADQASPLAGVTSLLTPITGLLNGLLQPQGTKMAPQEVQKHTDAIDSALAKAEKEHAAREPEAARDTAPDAMTADRAEPSDAATELRSAIDALLKGAAAGDMSAATKQLSQAVTALVKELATPVQQAPAAPGA
ncbi:hypothetical protein [Streptomyces sp. NPDC049813]|uniref:hypothetical protein n=1 Tax=Streptomyces sp. NPDC049813 TaxID=3365597 RepID=UPI0037994C28